MKLLRGLSAAVPPVFTPVIKQRQAVVEGGRPAHLQAHPCVGRTALDASDSCSPAAHVPSTFDRMRASPSLARWRWMKFLRGLFLAKTYRVIN